MRLRRPGPTVKGAAIVLCSFGFAALAPAAEPQPGTRDPGFVSGLGPNAPAQDLVVQPDGKIVVLQFIGELEPVVRKVGACAQI